MSERTRLVTKRILTWGLPAVLLAGLVAIAMRTPPEEVDLAIVRPGDLVVTVEDEGKTRVRERYVLSAPVDGTLLRVELEPGDPVRAGETVVATFVPRDPALLDARSRAEAEAAVSTARAGLEKARAERSRAEAELANARTELERLTRLRTEQIVAQEALDTAGTRADTLESSARAAAFAVEAAEHELARARAALVISGSSDNDSSAEVELRSPVDGVVLRRLRESRATLPAGEPLVEIGDPGQLEIVADLLSSDAVRVRPGQRAEIVRWGGDRTLAAVVRRVEPSGITKISALGVEEQRVDVVLDFTGDPESWSALGDGYRVEVAIITDSAEDVLVVPTSTLFRAGETWAVWAVEDDRATRREVEIGARNGFDAEVVAGLAEGDRVVVHPGAGIEEGTRLVERSP